jgi:UTP--glucose-1-phosphate uridylyltransferase
MSVHQIIEEKMSAAGQSDLAIRSFLLNLEQLNSGSSGLIPESAIMPVSDLPEWESLPDGDDRGINRTVVIKLNGGLGTSMGLDKAKSLLEVKDDLTFLDLIGRQILHLHSHGNPQASILFMNSFRTSADTLEYLAKYDDLGNSTDLEFIQSQVPKIDIESGQPAEFPDNPELEWCPPGHGDIYTALAGSGKLDELIAKGIEYAFISNSDNLGALPCGAVPNYMDGEGLDFLMEVTRRTDSDRKGGHLALKDGQLILRESAQCPESDMDSFRTSSAIASSIPITSGSSSLR